MAPSPRLMVETGPIAIRPDLVSDALKCSICLSIATNPAYTPCDHLFCTDCITAAVESSDEPTCPNCRTFCDEHDVRPLARGSLLYRVWSDIQVKCQHHEQGCSWTGSIQDETTHRKSCQFTRDYKKENAALRADIKVLRDKVAGLQDENAVLTLNDFVVSDKLQAQQAQQEEAERSRVALVNDRNNLSATLQNLQNDRRLTLPILFRGNYTYNRYNILELTQLISRYLLAKPAQVDQNKIFNCVRACYLDLNRDGIDWPDNYYLHVKTLLCTCLSSNWFTYNQRCNIEDWVMNQGWD